MPMPIAMMMNTFKIQNTHYEDFNFFDNNKWYSMYDVSISNWLLVLKNWWLINFYSKDFLQINKYLEIKLKFTYEAFWYILIQDQLSLSTFTIQPETTWYLILGWSAIWYRFIIIPYIFNIDEFYIFKIINTWTTIDIYINNIFIYSVQFVVTSSGLTIQSNYAEQPSYIDYVDIWNV